MRVNARLDDQRAEKLRLIQSLTGMSASDVLKHAIDLLHERQVAHAEARVDALLTSDLIGCSDGPDDLARLIDGRTKAICPRVGLGTSTLPELEHPPLRHWRFPTNHPRVYDRYSGSSRPDGSTLPSG